jgi:hypothetical protein
MVCGGRLCKLGAEPAGGGNRIPDLLRPPPLQKSPAPHTPVLLTILVSISADDFEIERIAVAEGQFSKNGYQLFSFLANLSRTYLLFLAYSI